MDGVGHQILDFWENIALYEAALRVSHPIQHLITQIEV